MVLMSHCYVIAEIFNIYENYFSKTDIIWCLTIEGLQQALSDLANKESPGVDGLTAEFLRPSLAH